VGRGRTRRQRLAALFRGTFLLLLGTQPIEVVDDLIGFAPVALVGLDGLDQVGRASIVQREDALSKRSHADELCQTLSVRLILFFIAPCCTLV
jgi:hypothetical protein